MHINKRTEEEQIKVVSECPWMIRGIAKPSLAVQMAAINADLFAFRYILHPHDSVYELVKERERQRFLEEKQRLREEKQNKRRKKMKKLKTRLARFMRRFKLLPYEFAWVIIMALLAEYTGSLFILVISIFVAVLSVFKYLLRIFSL